MRAVPRRQNFTRNVLNFWSAPARARRVAVLTFIQGVDGNVLSPRPLLLRLTQRGTDALRLQVQRDCADHPAVAIRIALSLPLRAELSLIIVQKFVCYLLQ